MNRDYFQEALHKFNTDKPNWYGWKTHDDNGNKIPNECNSLIDRIRGV